MSENELEKNLKEIERLSKIAEKTWANAESLINEKKYDEARIGYVRTIHCQNEINKLYNKIIVQQHQGMMDYLKEMIK